MSGGCSITPCTGCHGRGYVMRWRRTAGGRMRSVPVDCGRCCGSGVEPELSLRELQRLNQQRLREERS